ncbi:hypothetical protein V5J73_03715 [Flavobacterium sp. KS-LB2]|uniref:hypothetical protein n=1 Tax=Flavobacterium sp. KS-LB2 TaxID=3120525 RepID=UPI0030CCF910
MSAIGKLRFLQSLAQGYKTSRKIVVIESDDWGSERIPNKATQLQLNNLGVDMNKNPHSKLDTLERVEDLEDLELLLNEIESELGKKIKITTNFITANPDYAKIENSNFQEYSYQSFMETYMQRDGNDQVWQKLKSLINQGHFRPQFHGREHINALLWLKELQNNNQFFINAFHLGCYGIDAPSAQAHRKNLMAAFEYENEKENEFVATSIKEGMHLFEEAFGYTSSSIIAPRYVWNSALEKVFKAAGIKNIQTSFYQQEPTKIGYKNTYHYTGQVNKTSGLNYIVRNAYFEPAYHGTTDWVKATLDMVKLAFTFHTPAIISMHRINFVGGLDASAKEQSLRQFKILLTAIIKKYPDVEFLSSDELGHLIKTNYVRN